ncbi:family 1 glycosylhydrolase [Sphingosinicella terrae]|uniref:family 1 glycosylhydrolase n=1 Tax=Sphingosinicella terrae TaxID=2172047 RepID=UPI000E0CD80C|nr:family 1 glycosylhydrolase [Sphingosinicella terrae]
MADKAEDLELWGGAECTIVRIGDHWRDQAAETGHRGRAADLDLIAGLGIRTLRFPILWESIAPEGTDRCDFAWTDMRLDRLRELGIRPVAGLVHHGSGPAGTSLLDPDFPRKLGDFAARVAERYPWIEMWTPVNEPLTTARFSALYGHWYPHARDLGAFLRALVNQCLAVDAAMSAIRACVPRARLVQTEDLGKTFATRPLQGQARHENHRRWLSLDLLSGRVGPSHPMHPFLTGAGIAAAELERLEQGGGSPDIVGLNHYLTSERFLDDRLHLYPGEPAGGNGRDAYVDVEAVRVRRLAGRTGFVPRLREAWRRYRRPIALTEVHHGCTRDEQLRWVAEAWRSARDLRAEGVDIRAVTLWSLFGNVDWRSLLTQRQGCYDPGAFDIRGPAPRPTAIAQAAAHYARGEPFDHPILDGDGWWRRPSRFHAWERGRSDTRPAGRPILVTGASGTLGAAFGRVCRARGLAAVLTRRDEIDICDPDAIARALERYRPWAVINGAGFVRVADAARERDTCLAWNARGAVNLAEACDRAGIPIVAFSSDLVFDGKQGRPYEEEDPVSPACVYGESKAIAERGVSEANERALIVRTAAFFGPWDRYNFVHNVIDAARRGERVGACPLTHVSPTFVPDLCHAVLDLLIDGETGIRHLANLGSVSWHGFARRVTEASGLDPRLVVENPEPQPRSTALVSVRGASLRPLEQALAACLDEMNAAPARTTPAPA